jgi:hypothetical protein
MAEGYYLYGAGHLGEQIKKYLTASLGDNSFRGFFDDQSSGLHPNFEDLQRLVEREPVQILLTVGYSDLPGRFSLIEKLSGLENISFPNFIHPRAFVASDANLGQGNICLMDSIIGLATDLGSFNFVDSTSVVEHNSQLGCNNFLSAGTLIAGNCTIGDSNFLGLRTLISNDVAVGNDNFFGLNSVISKSVGNSKHIVCSFNKRETVR